ncbi:MAG: glycerate kinase [Acidobacteriota bacterium]
MIPLEEIHAVCTDIFDRALRACDIPKAFDRHLHFEGKTLVRHPSPRLPSVTQSLEGFREIYVVAFGKAGLTMLDALLERLPAKMPVHGVCSAPEVPKKKNRHIRYFAGGHPLPNEDSLAAARATLDLLKHAKKTTFIFFLISGGGSAMHELPRDKKITLDDTIAFHETLVASGATITEINTVRKFFSAVKGGRLALAAPDAEKLSLLLADVPLKDLAAVASSPTLPDYSTMAECEEILDRFHLLEKFPPAVREYFEKLIKDEGARALSEEEQKKAAVAFQRAQFDTLLSNHDFVNAARDHAQSLGYKVVIDNTCDDWDYAEAAKYLLARFHELRAEYARVCLLSSGEVTVSLGRNPGCGGRNQQFALQCALDLARYEGEPLAVLSAGSDGIDGNSPAAGAIADTTTIARARQYNFDPEATLTRFDTCTLFTALGDSVVTGPTGNNLRDLRILIAG